MPLSGSHFEDSTALYQQRDPQLHEELRRKFAAPRPEFLEDARRRVGIAAEAPLVNDRGEATPHGRAVAETIVKASARPVLVIRNNRATTKFLGPDSEVWAKRITAAQSVLDRVIPSVGRVELKNNPDFQWVGTGWMVAPDIIVTNRHVAREFARLGPQGFTFRLGLNRAPQAARVDFLEEFQRTASLEFQIESILWIANPNDPDVAFLRTKRSVSDGELPPPLKLADSVAVDDFVATIGYPARDPRVPDQDMVRRIFGDVYEKKRLAPGQVIDSKDDELEHDCSTLGGNSGSAVVSLATGDAVGLHFSGLFMEANFAVPAPKLRELLTKAQKGDLPGMAPAVVSPEPVVRPPAAPGTFTFQLQIPIEVSVKVGAPVSVDGGGAPPTISVTVPAQATPADYERVLAAARETYGGLPDVLDIRLGYRFKNGWITDEQVIVVEVREKLSVTELQQAGKLLIPAQIMGVGTDVRTAALPDQLSALGIDMEVLEAPARAGLYREPPNLQLKRVNTEKMTAVFHVSPDSGFPNLKKFLQRVEKHLTATIFEWQPTHISDAIAAAMAGPGHTLKMVTQPHFSIFEGTEDAVNDMRQRIGNKFKHVFASVGSGKLIPSAYHIKVASRDGEEFWLSSGNWKDSNQADIDPAGENSHKISPLRQHNREWHAIIANGTLAKMFQDYIDFDFDEAQRVPFEEGPVVAFPEVFIPEEAFAEPEVPIAVQYFDPLEIKKARIIDIQPLLTPDRDSHQRHIFIKFATQLAQEATTKIYVQNQSFSISEDQDEYEQFFATLRDKQKDGLDVRIIFRDPRDFPNGDEALHKTLEKIKTFKLDTDFVKVQKKCHTKGIIVDAKQIILGSQNLTAGGSLFNRDASLLIRDADVAAYFEQIFLFDWERLAVQDSNELVGGMRLAQPGEAAPVGFRRVSVAELVGWS